MKNSILSNYKKFSLEPYTGRNSRHICPKCGDKHSFTYYIDIETGEPLNEKVGKCDHDSSCGYHYPPKQYFQDNGNSEWYNTQITNYTPPRPAPISFFEKKYLIETETNYNNNNFVQFLLTKFDRHEVLEIIKMYRVGTSDYPVGATIFWYLDKRNRVRSGKVMSYDKATGKRLKTDGVPNINSMRSILIKKGVIDADFNQKTGLFGEHLLVGNLKPIAIVESEKTAIIASLEFPQYLWLAAGSKSFLTKERTKVLKGLEVILYPDNDAYELWHEKASEYRFEISFLLLDKSEIPNYDLADYILENKITFITEIK